MNRNMQCMNKPFARLKLLPWRSLLQAAFLAVLLVALPIDLLLQLVARADEPSPVLEHLLPIVLLVMSLGLPIGIGALAVYWFERLDRISINTSSLWALVPCLALVLLLEKWLLFKSISFSMTTLVLLAVGVFWKGRSYWRSYQRW